MIQEDSKKKQEETANTEPSAQPTSFWSLLYFMAREAFDRWPPKLVLILILFLGLIGLGAHRMSEQTTKPSDEDPTEKIICEAIEFSQIKNGTNLTDVRSLMGSRGVEISSKGDLSTHVWYKGKVKITVEFKNDVVIGKAQEDTC